MNASVIWMLSSVLIFSALTLLIYSNTLESPFVFDDIPGITENSDIRINELNLKNLIQAAFGKESSKSRPVGNITFALNYYFHQYVSGGYHLVNIIIHILAGVILFYFLKTTLMISSGQLTYHRASLIAFFAALIWLAHPIQTQSVTYIVQRHNSLAALFYILSLLLYAKGRISQFKALEYSPAGDDKATRKKRLGNNYLWFLGCVLSGMLALGSKQNAATLPVMIFFYEWYFFQDLSPKWFKSSLKYIIAIAVIFAAVAFLYLGTDPLGKISKMRDFSHGEFTLAERALTQTRVVVYT